MESAKKIKSKQIVFGLGAVVGFVFILIFGMWISDPNKGKPSALETRRAEASEVKKNYRARSVDAITPEQSWVANSEAGLSEMKINNRDLKNALIQLNKRLETMEKSLNTKKSDRERNDRDNQGASPAVGKLPPPPNLKQVPITQPGTLPPTSQNVKEKLVSNILPPTPNALNSKNAVNKGGKPISMIEVFSFEDKNSERGEKKKSMNISHYLPSGSFGKVLLLSGVDAPTGGEAESNPIPILMRLLDHGTLPNHFNSEIKDCSLTGDVKGDLASERGKIRLERLSCVLINGDVIEVVVDGYITGEDGKEGFRGKVVEKAGALLAKTFVAGTFSGIGTNVASQYQNVSQSALGTVTSIDPSDVGKAGVATGLSNSMEKLADYYMNRANEMYPIVEIGANRIGEFVLTKGVDLNRNIAGNMKE